MTLTDPIHTNSGYFGGFGGFHEVLRPNTWLIFYMDMFIVPLYTIRCQSGSLTQFALSRFFRWGWRRSLPGCYASQICHQETATTPYFVKKIERETRWWKFYVATIHSFWNMLMQSWKIADFAKIWYLAPKNGSIFDLGSKNALRIASNCRIQSAGFSLSLRPIVSNRAGVLSAPPPPARPRYEINRARARVNLPS